MLDALNAAYERLAQVNAYVLDRRLRRYQSDILQTGAFSIASPFNGASLQCASAHILSYVNEPYRFDLPLYVYRFEDVEPVFACSFQIGQGFPLAVLYVPGRFAGYVGRHPGDRFPSAALKRIIEQIDQTDFGALPVDPSETPLAVVGHPNFAHHFWNELPALRAAIEAGLSPFAIATLFEPAGAVEDLLGGARATPVASGALARTRPHPPFLTPVGAQWIDPATARSLRDSLPEIGAGLTAETAQRLQDAERLIWIAHRTDGRTCENFFDFLFHFDRLLQAERATAYLFDSFCDPADFRAPAYDPVRDRFDFRREEARRLLDKARDQLVDPGTRLIVGTDTLTIPEALSLSLTADFYIAPIGSLQHKAAWLSGAPGLIHGPKSTMTPAVAGWHQHQSAASRQPEFMPAELIETTDGSAAHPQAERNRNYRFIDPERAARFAAERLSRRRADAAPD